MIRTAYNKLFTHTSSVTLCGLFNKNQIKLACSYSSKDRKFKTSSNRYNTGTGQKDRSQSKKLEPEDFSSFKPSYIPKKTKT